LHWILLFEEYEVTCEYLPGKKNVGTVAGALSIHDIDSLKNQESSLDQKIEASLLSNQQFQYMLP
jgi:hypothetical protein